MADPTARDAEDGAFVGVFMVEQPAGWWLPPGYSLTPTGSTRVLVTDPAGQAQIAYPIPGYRPTPERSDSVADVVERELGPVPTEGIGPKAREALGMNRNDLLGAVNRTIMAPVDLAAMLLDLANYGIDAGIVAGTAGAARAGWMTESSAGSLRRDLELLTVVVGAEAGRAPGAFTAEARAAQLRVATAARASVRMLPPVVVRMDRAVGEPFARLMRVVDVVETDASVPGAQARTFDSWLVRVRAGQRFDRQQAIRYRFNQVYVVKDSGNGYWILDSYGPQDAALGAGPVSRKFTQLAEIQPDCAAAMLREASRKYRPGAVIADVPSRPERLTDTVISGQLWLEVPVQTASIPNAILREAARLSIKIRDVSGKVY